MEWDGFALNLLSYQATRYIALQRKQEAAAWGMVIYSDTKKKKTFLETSLKCPESENVCFGFLILFSRKETPAQSSKHFKEHQESLCSLQILVARR